MKNSRMHVFALVAGVLVAGCSKGGQPAAVALEDVPQTVHKAFDGKNVKPEVTEQVNKALADVQQRDPGALQELQSLSATSEMTPEQRSAIAKSMAAYMKHLQEEAEKGNAKAKQALDKYIATK